MGKDGTLAGVGRAGAWMFSGLGGVLVDLVGLGGAATGGGGGGGGGGGLGGAGCGGGGGVGTGSFCSCTLGGGGGGGGGGWMIGSGVISTSIAGVVSGGVG